MHITVSDRSLKSIQRHMFEALVHQKADHLGRIMSSWQAGNLHLRACAEWQEREQLFMISLKLKVPHRVLVASAGNKDLGTAFHGAFNGLEEEAKRYKARQIHHSLRHRRSELRHAEHQTLKMLQAQRQSVTEFANSLTGLIPALMNYAAREIQLSQMAGTLGTPDLEPAELVNQTILRAYEIFDSRPAPDHVLGWLYALMQKQAEQDMAVDTQLSDRHLEDLVAEQPELLVSDQGDSRLDFWQPDDLLEYEHILPDGEHLDPAHALDAQELSQAINQALARMPTQQRWAFVMHALEGFEPLEIAMLQRREEDDVASELEYTRSLLRQAVSESWRAA